MERTAEYAKHAEEEKMFYLQPSGFSRRNSKVGVTENEAGVVPVDSK
jgi:hypothetical protein